MTASSATLRSWHRYQQTAVVNGVPETTVYVGNLEMVTTGGVTYNRHRLSAYGHDVLTYAMNSNGSRTFSYMHSDHLGSVDAVTDATGAPVGSFGYGPFGQRRDPASGQVPQPSSEVSTDRTITHRGFTNHEMLDNVALIHMNGRVYDPVLGRFLSVDPVFQFPTNGQSLNPYSYVLNNPLSATDPSGYDSCPQSSGGGAACTDSGLKVGDTASVQVKVTTTAIGSHTVQHGTATLTGVVQKDGSVAVYLGNGSQGQNDADKSGTSQTDLHGVQQTAQSSNTKLGDSSSVDIPIDKTSAKDKQQTFNDAMRGLGASQDGVVNGQKITFENHFETADTVKTEFKDPVTGKNEVGYKLINKMRESTLAKAKDDIVNTDRGILNGATAPNTAQSTVYASAAVPWKVIIPTASGDKEIQLSAVQHMEFVIEHEIGHGKGAIEEHDADVYASKALNYWNQ